MLLSILANVEMLRLLQIALVDENKDILNLMAGEINKEPEYNI